MTRSAPSRPAPQRPRMPVRRRLASGRAVGALALREMTASHGGAPGGFLWAVIEPVAGIALLTVIFSIGFRAPALGTNFPIFYATGMMPFLLYVDVSGKVAQALLFSRPLLAYPSVTYLDALVARFAVALLTQLMVTYIVLGGIVLLFETRTVADPAAIGAGFAMAAALALGIGTMNAFLFTAFPAWQRIWSIVNRPLFLVSCIFFTFETIPQPWRDMLWYNPLVHVVGMVRHGFYPSYDASYVSPLYVTGLALGAGVVGLLFLGRYHRNLMDS